MGHNWKSYSCNQKRQYPYNVPKIRSRRPEAKLVATAIVFLAIGFCNLCIILYNGMVKLNGKK